MCLKDRTITNSLFLENIEEGRRIVLYPMLETCLSRNSRKRHSVNRERRKWKGKKSAKACDGTLVFQTNLNFSMQENVEKTQE